MKFCPNCGNKLNEGADFCTNCGKMIAAKKESINPNAKSKVAAGLFGIFLGSLGVHNFYLGYTGKAVAQLLLTIIGWVIIIGPFVASLWGLIEGIMILSGSIDKDVDGVKLAN